MAIKLQCTCGATCRAKDRLAGSRIRCPTCGSPIAVPRSDVEVIRFTCRCGKQLKAPRKKAGKRGECPFCGVSITISQSERLDGKIAPPRLADLATALPEGEPHPPLPDEILHDFAGPSATANSDARGAAACPHCHVAISPAAILCIACGYHFQKGRRLGSANQAGAKRTRSSGGESGEKPNSPSGETHAAASLDPSQEVSPHGPAAVWKRWQDAHKPRLPRVRETPAALKMESLGNGQLPGALTYVLILGLTFPLVFLSLFFHVFLNVPEPLLIALFILTSVLLPLGLGRYDCRSTSIEVDREQMVVYQVGRLPLPAFQRTIPVDDIVHLDVVEKTRSGPGGGHWDEFWLLVVRKNGRRIRLAVFDRETDATWSAERIKNFLSLHDMRIESSWFQRWIKDERSLDDQGPN